MARLIISGALGTFAEITEEKLVGGIGEKLVGDLCAPTPSWIGLDMCQPHVCNRYHDTLIMHMSLSDIAILNTDRAIIAPLSTESAKVKP